MTKTISCFIFLTIILFLFVGGIFDISKIETSNIFYGLSLYGFYELCRFLCMKISDIKEAKEEKYISEHEIDYVNREALKELLLANMEQNLDDSKRVCDFNCPFLNKCEECYKRNPLEKETYCRDCSYYTKHTENKDAESCEGCKYDCKHKLGCKVFTRHDFFVTCHEVGCKNLEFWTDWFESHKEEEDYCMLATRFKDNENIQKLVKEIKDEIEKERGEK